MIDHFDRLCLLGYGRLSGEDLESDPQDAAKEVLTLGRLWEQMTAGAAASPESLDPARGIAEACRQGVYASPGDLASDFDALLRGAKGAWQRGSAPSKWRLWS